MATRAARDTMDIRARVGGGWVVVSVDSRCPLLSEIIWFVEKSSGWVSFVGLVGDEWVMTLRKYMVLYGLKITQLQWRTTEMSRLWRTLTHTKESREVFCWGRIRNSQPKELQILRWQCCLYLHKYLVNHPGITWIFSTFLGQSSGVVPFMSWYWQCL